MDAQSDSEGESIQLNHQTTDYRKRAEEKLSKGNKRILKKLSLKEMEHLVQELELHQVEMQMQNEELRAAQEALEASRNSYAELYDFAPVGYFSFDEKGSILKANLSGAAQLGVEREQLSRMPFIVYVDEEYRRAFYAHLKAVFKDKSHQRVEIKISRTLKGGERKEKVPFYAELESLYFETEGGEECRTVLNDITKQKETEEQIRKMNELTNHKNIQLQETSRARNRFFSFISHELKTPLNSIIGYTHLLSKGNYGQITPEQEKALLRQSVSEGKMVQLINNILDMAKIETEKIPTQRIEIDLLDLLDRIPLSFDPFIKEKGLHFEKKFDPSCPKTFSTDPEKIRSIVTNLLSNAIKFTREGTVRLTAEPLPKTRGIRLTVSDTGIGIKPQDLGRIFEEYAQSGFVQENPIRYTSGSGLGLAIVRTMVSLLGGTVGVKSDFGRGTTFVVDLPGVFHPQDQRHF